MLSKPRLTMASEPGQRTWNGIPHTFRLLALCLLAQATTVLGLNFNVTLLSLTNNNTSACSNYSPSFGGLVAQNFGPTSVVDTNNDTININSNLVDMSLNAVTPGHVSHVDVHTLIPSRPDLRWFANGTCWWGEGPSHHVDNGTTNTTAAYAAAMVTDMENRGFNGIIFSWYGKGDQTDTVAQNVKAFLDSTNNPNTNFTFTIMIVMGYFSGGETVANVESNIFYCQTNYFSDAHYETEQGHPLLMFFNVSTAYFSQSQMDTMKADTSANTYWVQEDVGEIGDSWVDMTYQWTDDYHIGNTNELSGSTPYNLNAVTNDFATIKANPGKQAYGAMCAHFNGTLTKSYGWSLGKYLPSNGGLCEYYRAQEINQVIPTNMTRMQWATWSDYEEGTEIEVGTENYYAVTPQLTSTNLLSWTITSGDERTIDHYDIYASTNGVNAALLCSVPAGIHQTNLSQLGLTSGTYKLYVNSVAIPCVRDHLSAPVTDVISGAPTVLSDVQPLFQTVWQTDPVAFAVTGGGQPPLHYQWTLNGQNIAGATNASYAFAAVTGTNYYSVTITNAQGSVNSSTGEVVGVTGTFLNPSNYYGMRITFKGYTNGGSLTDFPVLVCLSNNLPGFSYAQFVSPATGADLRFASESGRELPFQIDQWNSSGKSLIWVQVPSLTGTNDYITACWGNSADSAMPPSNTNGTTWSTLSGVNDFLLVYHLGQTGFPYADSTLQYPANSGSAPASTNGIVGLGAWFSRSPYLDAGTVNLGSAFTLSTWANVSSGVSDIQCLWANGPGVAESSQVFFYVNDYKTDDGALVLTTGDGGSSQDQVEAPSGTVSLNQWHLLTATVDRVNQAATIYVDGNQVATGAAMSDFPTNNDMNFARDTGGSFNFLGALDEARIQSGVASSNWVWASYMTVAANSTLESYATVVPPVVSLGIQLAGGNVILTWPEGTLQSASQAAGPYANVSNATSPYTNTVPGTRQFFRVKVP